MSADPGGKNSITKHTVNLVTEGFLRSLASTSYKNFAPVERTKTIKVMVVMDYFLKWNLY